MVAGLRAAGLHINGGIHQFMILPMRLPWILQGLLENHSTSVRMFACRGSLAQLVELRTLNPSVVGSNPTRPI